MTASQFPTTVDSIASANVDLAAPPGKVATAIKSLKERVLSGSAWLAVGYGSTQAMRLVSSIILSRLIAPEVTGLMAMVTVFLVGLEMFSDVGIHPSVIQNKRGGERSFLNTAWTIQIGRGWALWIASCIGAWPISQFFGEPLLLWLIPVVGFTAVISGFDSTAVPTLLRQVNLKRLTILGIINQLFSYVVIITWAWFSPNVWAIVGGTMISTVTYTIATHFLIPGHRDRIQWNSEDARSLFRFGRWIFISTVLTFLAQQTDKIMCGKMIGKSTLGVYTYALAIAMIAPQFIKQISMEIAFPLLSEVNRTQPQRMYIQLLRVRLALMACSLLVLLPLMFFGRHIVQLLYDERWWDAGWMLQILAGGALGGLVNSSYGGVLLAKGKSHSVSALLAVQLVFLVGGALIGYRINGEVGFIIGVAAVEWLNYPVTAYMMARNKLWQPVIDLPILAIAVVAIGVTIALM